MRTPNSTRYSRSLTYSATAPKLSSMRSAPTPNWSMPVGSTWSRRSVQESSTPGGTEPLASSGCEEGAGHGRARGRSQGAIWREQVLFLPQYGTAYVLYDDQEAS